MTDPLLTPAEVAELLRISPRALRKLRRRRPLPFYRVGGALRFRRPDVDAWLEAMRVDPAGQAAPAPPARPARIAITPEGKPLGTGGSRWDWIADLSP